VRISSSCAGSENLRIVNQQSRSTSCFNTVPLRNLVGAGGCDFRTTCGRPAEDPDAISELIPPSVACLAVDWASSPSLGFKSRLRFLLSRPSGPGTLVNLTGRDLTSFSFLAARFPYAGRQSITVPYAGGKDPFAGVCLLTLKAKSLELTISGQQTRC
jgi:hypothetical protein